MRAMQRVILIVRHAIPTRLRNATDKRFAPQTPTSTKGARPANVSTWLYSKYDYYYSRRAELKLRRSIPSERIRSKPLHETYYISEMLKPWCQTGLKTKILASASVSAL